jgi:hypothetical protein
MPGGEAIYPGASLFVHAQRFHGRKSRTYGFVVMARAPLYFCPFICPRDDSPFGQTKPHHPRNTAAATSPPDRFSDDSSNVFWPPSPPKIPTPVSF